MASFVNSNGNTFINNIAPPQMDETCYYELDGKKCPNVFQEKCNTCQYMFCRKHLFVKERLFLCDNCRSIDAVNAEVNIKMFKCYQAATFCSICFCIGPISYCASVPFCLPMWSADAHNKNRIQPKPHVTCRGFKALCGLVTVECSGHGPVNTSSSPAPQTMSDEKQPLSPSGNGGGGNVATFTNSNNNLVTNSGGSGNQATFTQSNSNEMTSGSGGGNVGTFTESNNNTMTSQTSGRNVGTFTGSENNEMNNS